MRNRRISTLAIAGLTSLAVAVTPLTAPNNTILSAAVAEAQQSALAFSEGPATVNYNTTANFTVNVPSAEAKSKIQFFLDNVPVKTVTVSGGTATVQITPKSYGQHKVTARYVDPQGFNTRADVDRPFTTAVDVPYVDKGPGREDANDTYKSAVNGAQGTTTKPVVVQPGAEVTLTANMVVNNGRFSLPTRVYEMGINPPVGAEFKSASRTDQGASTVTARGKTDGTAGYTGQGTDAGTSWGRNGNPSVNPGFFGINVNDLYYVRDIGIKGVFKAPTVPGLYVPQHSYYKFTTNQTHYLRRMDNAVFRVAEPPLPARKERTNSTVALAAGQTFVAGQKKDLQITVTPGNANGKLTVKHGNKVLGTDVAVTAGKATIKDITFSEAGEQTLALEFTSTTPGVNSSTGTGTITVSDPAQKTELKLDVPKGEVPVDELIDLKATVSPAAPGKVEFFAGDAPLGEAEYDPATGEATLSASFEEAGEKQIKAVFTPTDTTKFEKSEATGAVKVVGELTEEKSLADQNTPEAVTGDDATFTVGDQEPKPEDFIKDADKLPAGTEFGWAVKPDFTAAGNQQGTVTVTYSDGSTDEVKVTVNVKDTTKPTTTTATSSTTAPTTTTTPTTTTPTTTTTAPTSTVVTSTTSTSAKPTTTKPTTVTSTTEQKKSDVEAYEPKAKQNAPTVDGAQGTPEPLEFISNAGELPGGTVFEWKKQPDLNKDGKQDAVITVKYPDGTSEAVLVSVAVKAAPKQGKPTSTTSTSTTPAASTTATTPTTPTTTGAEPTKSGSSGSSDKGEKDAGGGSSVSTPVKVVLGILFSLIGIVAGFGAWNYFMKGHGF